MVAKKRDAWTQNQGRTRIRIYVRFLARWTAKVWLGEKRCTTKGSWFRLSFTSTTINTCHYYASWTYAFVWIFASSCAHPAGVAYFKTYLLPASFLRHSQQPVLRFTILTPTYDSGANKGQDRWSRRSRHWSQWDSLSVTHQGGQTGHKFVKRPPLVSHRLR